MSDNEIDKVSGTETTGHEWDGIKELNTPLPRWWLWTFYATIVWAVGYAIAYPAIPLVRDATDGVFGWSSRADVAEQLASADEARADVLERIGDLGLEEIRSDPDLFQFAVAGGASSFKVYCSQCHGSGAAGGPGYPNLNDDAWIWGGTLDDIHTTITHGVRDEADAATRVSAMPAFGADRMLARPAIRDVSEYVLALAGREHEPEAAARGETVYADNCAACHGARGQGEPALGAPSLGDGLWLYGGDRNAIAAQIWKPRHGVMPAWGRRLDETTLKQLAIYVHALGGGE